MDNSFFAYLQRLELMAFFSGYALLYTVVIFIAGNLRLKNNAGNRAVSLLPFAYALVGTLFLGFQLKKLYPDYSFEHLKQLVQQPLLMAWGLLSLLFWIPAAAKKGVWSLLHSLVFFMLLVWDLFLQFTTPSADSDVLKNDVKVYINSLLLNLGAFAFIMLFAFIFARYKKRITT